MKATPSGDRLDLLIQGGLCLTLNARGDLIENCEIGVSGGEIRFVRPAGPGK